MRVPKWKLFQYFGVYRITETRDGCIYKTKFEGYIHKDSAAEYDTNHFVLSSVSTDLHKGSEATVKLTPWLG